MSLISVYSDTGIRYLDNLVSTYTKNDGICYSSYPREFDGTQTITFPLAVGSGNYLIYFDFTLKEYVQQSYLSTTFSTTGIYSNFIIWNRQLTSVELSYINKNPEFLYFHNTNNSFRLEVGVPTSLVPTDCQMWVPMLPDETGTGTINVLDWISKTNATITNHTTALPLNATNIGPQLMAYNNVKMSQVLDTVYIQDYYIDTNMVLPVLESWTVEEVANGKHLVYVYSYTDSTLTRYLNGEAIDYENYTPSSGEVQISNISFYGNINVNTRGVYAIYGQSLNKAQVKDLYNTYSLNGNILTLLQGNQVLLDPDGLQLTYRSN